MTVSIYQQTADGLLRLGTMRTRGGNSIRAISQSFYKRHPHASGQYFLKARSYICGRWTDTGDLIPLEPR